MYICFLSVFCTRSNRIRIFFAHVSTESEYFLHTFHPNQNIFCTRSTRIRIFFAHVPPESEYFLHTFHPNQNILVHVLTEYEYFAHVSIEYKYFFFTYVPVVYECIFFFLHAFQSNVNIFCLYSNRMQMYFCTRSNRIWIILKRYVIVTDMLESNIEVNKSELHSLACQLRVQKGVSVLDMTLNHLMLSSSNAGALGNAE